MTETHEEFLARRVPELLRHVAPGGRLRAMTNIAIFDHLMGKTTTFRLMREAAERKRTKQQEGNDHAEDQEP